jgi:hypothetical protein
MKYDILFLSICFDITPVAFLIICFQTRDIFDSLIGIALVFNKHDGILHSLERSSASIATISPSLKSKPQNESKLTGYKNILEKASKIRLVLLQHELVFELVIILTTALSNITGLHGFISIRLGLGQGFISIFGGHTLGPQLRVEGTLPGNL